MSDLPEFILDRVFDAPPEMVWHHHSATDAAWNDDPNPRMPHWPRLLMTTVTFEALGEQTNVRLSQIPHEASAAEIACFAEMRAGFANGWGKGYAVMDEMFTELQAGGG